MLSKRYAPILLLSLILALAGCFMAFADEADEETAAETEMSGESEGSEGSSSMIVSNDIMKIWEQAENDEYSGPDLLNALIGKEASDPDAIGIASAVIGRKGNREIELPGNDTEAREDMDAFMAYYLAWAELLNNAQANMAAGPGVSGSDTSAASAVDTTPITDAEGRELIPLGRFAITKYCPCKICSGGSGSGITASGTRARANHTIAADTRLYPFGTQLMVNGIIYTVEDTGGAVKGNTVDIFVNDHAEAVAYGTQYADVYLVK